MNDLKRYTTYLTDANKEKLERFARANGAPVRTFLNSIIAGLTTAKVPALLFGVRKMQRPQWRVNIRDGARLITTNVFRTKRTAQDFAREWLQQRRTANDGAAYVLNLTKFESLNLLATEFYESKGAQWHRTKDKKR